MYQIPMPCHPCNLCIHQCYPREGSCRPKLIHFNMYTNVCSVYPPNVYTTRCFCIYKHDVCTFPSSLALTHSWHSNCLFSFRLKCIENSKAIFVIVILFVCFVGVVVLLPFLISEISNKNIFVIYIPRESTQHLCLFYFSFYVRKKRKKFNPF